MDNIIEFPTKSVRDWDTIEKSMLAELIKGDISQDVQDRLIENMKAF